jgi:hypothetical protein
MALLEPLGGPWGARHFPCAREPEATKVIAAALAEHGAKVLLYLSAKMME